MKKPTVELLIFTKDETVMERTVKPCIIPNVNDRFILQVPISYEVEEYMFEITARYVRNESIQIQCSKCTYSKEELLLAGFITR